MSKKKQEKKIQRLADEAWPNTLFLASIFIAIFVGLTVNIFHEAHKDNVLYQWAVPVITITSVVWLWRQIHAACIKPFDDLIRTKNKKNK